MPFDATSGQTLRLADRCFQIEITNAFLVEWVWHPGNVL